MKEIMEQTCTIWRASLHGECKQIAPTEADLWHELENHNFWFQGTRRDQWVVSCADEDLPIVQGSSSDGGLHICWACPHCGETHDTDREESCSPAIWYCENDEGIALVKWDIEQQNPEVSPAAVASDEA